MDCAAQPPVCLNSFKPNWLPCNRCRGTGEKKTNCISLSSVFGAERAKARGEASGLEDPGLTPLPFQKEAENPARMKKISSK